MSAIEELARSKFGEPNRHLSSRRELRFGRRGSISVALDGERAGAWFDHEAQEGGWLGERTEHQRPAPLRRGHIENDPDRARALAEMLSRAVSADGTATEAYLRSRGIDDWPAHSVRHCTAPHGALWVARDGAGAVKAVQIVYLTQDGQKDRTHSVVKRTLCAGRGWHHTSAVILPGRGEPVLCEGVETGLSAWLATKRPVYCGMGPGIFGAYYIKAKRLTFGEDGNLPFDPNEHDEMIRRKMTADRTMAAAVRARQAQGKLVKRVRPPLGEDFNSVHMAHGLNAVRKLFRAAA